MKIKTSGKELIFLAVIFLILALGILFLAIKMNQAPSKSVVSDTNIINMLVIIDDGNGNAISSNVISYYPPTKRAAMFDIPANTGLILQSLGRTDGVASLYKEKDVETYKDTIENITGITIPIYLIINLTDISNICDMLGGVSIFIPTPIDLEKDGVRVLLPSGSILLDGDKMYEYLVYQEEDEAPASIAFRKQQAILAVLREMNEHSAEVFSKAAFKNYSALINSNLEYADLQKLLSELCKFNSDRLVPQRLTGSLKRTADDKELLFPFRNGQQFKEVVKQALSVLASEDGGTLERIYALEILNGTNKQGLAKGTSEIFQSFGYDVVSIGNTEEPVEKTILKDRIGNPGVAKVIADVIKCTNIESAELPDSEDFTGTETAVDFTIILGEDFNGYYVK